MSDEITILEGKYKHLTYKKYIDYIVISECEESAENVVIPAEIDSLPVTVISRCAFYSCSNLKSITISDGVTSIGDYAFSDCSRLESITIPESVTSIGNGAFQNCSWLKSIIIPDSVTSIGNGAFQNCSWLKSIIIPDSITSIEDSTFFYCTGLMSITIPDSVTSIGDSAFLSCSNLKSITIPDSVTSIGYEAFLGCSSLKSITIPDSVTSIGYHAFNSCSSLEKIYVSENNENYCILEGVLFNKDKTELLVYPIQKDETEYIIPNSMTSIGEYALSSCKNLKSIMIPDSVTSIGNRAFSNCSGLTSITILNPDCEIFDNSCTICNVTIFNYESTGYFKGTIRGYSGSTAQAYAEKYGYNFEAIGEIEIPETLLGDANCDGEISVADATLVLQYCGNKDKYKLSEQGLINADVDGTAGISAVDALRIQQYDAGVIENF